MKLFRWAESRIRTFTVWDMAWFKLCLVAFTLMVAKLWPTVLGLDWYWYGLLFADAYLRIMARMLARGES